MSFYLQFLVSPSFLGGLSDPQDLLQFVLRDTSTADGEPGGGGGFVCGLCYQFRHMWKNNVRNHVEMKHFKGTFVYTCRTCGQPKSSKQEMYACRSEHRRQGQLQQQLH
jgi:hypothetical protein